MSQSDYENDGDIVPSPSYPVDDEDIEKSPKQLSPSTNVQPPAGAQSGSAVPARRGSKSSRYDRAAGDSLEEATKALAGQLMLTLFSSILHLAFWAFFCNLLGNACNGDIKYAIAVGAISMSVIVIYGLIFFLKPDILPDKSLVILSLFLFIWWTIAVAVLTFRSAAVNTGFFTTWASFMFSGMILYSELDQFRGVVNRMTSFNGNRQPEFLLFLASLVVIGSSIAVCIDINCGTNPILALVFGGVSAGLTACLLFLSSTTIQPAVRKGFAITLILLWSVGLGIFTIDGPFRTNGNGLLACWGAFLASFFVAQEALFPGRQNGSWFSFNQRNTASNQTSEQKEKNENESD